MRKARRKVSSRTVRLEPEQLAQLQLQLAAATPPRPPTPVRPTFSQLFERFLTWSTADRQKPATIDAKKCLWRVHLEPRLAEKRIDELTHADVEALKGAKLSAKRVNTLLSVLRKMLRLAVKWGELEQLPCAIDAVRETPPDFEYYDFARYDALIAGAAKLGKRELAVVLLGGDAGLRMGEQLGLQRGDVDLARAQLHVRRADYLGELVAPKGGRSRVVPLTRLLVEALKSLFADRPEAKGDARVLVAVAGDHQLPAGGTGGPLTVQRIRSLMERAQRAANLEAKGNLHVLRHTFCSHLAMRGAPTLAIKKLAGHVSISTTERYMHLADPERLRAIGLLDAARVRNLPRVVEHRSPPEEAGNVVGASTLTPTRFELVGVSQQKDWLEYLLGSPHDS